MVQTRSYENAIGDSASLHEQGFHLKKPTTSVPEGVSASTPKSSAGYHARAESPHAYAMSQTVHTGGMLTRDKDIAKSDHSSHV